MPKAETSARFLVACVAWATAASSRLSVSAPCRNTALHLASKNGHTESVKALLEKGADVHAENGSGETAFHVAKDRRAYIAAAEVRCLRAIAIRSRAMQRALRLA
jgi:hypothetical protein